MSQSYILDTNVLLNLVRGHDLGRTIDRAFGLSAAFHRHLVSIVSHGELWVLASRHQWGDQKCGALIRALQELVTVNVDSSSMVDAYVRVEESCRNAPGGERKMAKTISGLRLPHSMPACHSLRPTRTSTILMDV